MNASKITSAAMAPIMALNTKADGSNLCRNSKSDAIADSKARLGAVLCPLLERGVARNVLTRCKPETQAAAVSLRRKTPDLIDLSKIFGPYCIEDVSRQFSLRPMIERESKTSHTRWFPVDVCSREMAACFDQFD